MLNIDFESAALNTIHCIIKCEEVEHLSVLDDLLTEDIQQKSLAVVSKQLILNTIIQGILGTLFPSGNFPMVFLQVVTSQMCNFPSCNFSMVFSQEATSQICNFPSGNFPKRQLPKSILAADCFLTLHFFKTCTIPSFFCAFLF